MLGHCFSFVHASDNNYGEDSFAKENFLHCMIYWPWHKFPYCTTARQSRLYFGAWECFGEEEANF